MLQYGEKSNELLWMKENNNFYSKVILLLLKKVNYTIKLVKEKSERNRLKKVEN